RSVFLRVAESDGDIYLDLCDPEWRVVRISPRGWEIVNGEPPIVFRRGRGMAALPIPIREGTLSTLRQFVNVGSEQQFTLLVGWMLAALRPPGQPCPILTFSGEQGSAKSTAERVCRALVDPNLVPLRAAPRDQRDLAISARNAWVVALDNLSHLPR